MRFARRATTNTTFDAVMHSEEDTEPVTSICSEVSEAGRYLRGEAGNLSSHLEMEYALYRFPTVQEVGMI